jgi:peptidoglycan L-alanyl-D-glutamate endopeptidase CwlK
VIKGKVMAYSLGTKSRKELEGVHPKLIKVVERAIAISKQDFSVHDGLRTEAEQREYVRRGVSKTMNSKHRPQADGFSHAVDLVPYINGQLRWEWKPIYVIASAVHQAAREQGVQLTWGAVWDKAFLSLPCDPEDLEKAVNAYVDRRRKAGKSAFIDGPHFQLGNP